MHKKKQTGNIKQIRREYTHSTLSQKNLTNEPIQLFKIWLNQACKSKMLDPTAMCLATIDELGQPCQRLVLLKTINKNKIIFYTNFKSKKAMHIQHNPKVSVCFPWTTLDRQVIISGYASKLPKKDNIKYFYSRPRHNQISTWVSHQSEIINSRTRLTKRFLYFKKKFLNIKVPVPNFWGGYQIYITTMEFWQGRAHRLHDRFIYKKKDKKWHIDRLSP
ncbi:pyridoxamine 5'-phosphate oxidase [Blochmannia endosymbiont of Polyrhachis (Hedomyrma) turneri]|uniref:pyridoxamine 5'-phosphate oxidase n=1 Tax=Blochmannia endosymbiont of Polyrhachis (Hedomyrma) turneri TaxID=1505596 RepID=UPI00061A89CE|nr:pyridoxamine 5'-phosphate oxidase [Blochmannia endosymbiont of Polyrhachis (Hedomyrma) turneri]AKC59936.1 Pyridoxine/pyridoxamine 5'-phosphate oxidase [Blochmannia endosymbiont of Polyrhachis (Hedomyrma) turneri]